MEIRQIDDCHYVVADLNQRETLVNLANQCKAITGRVDDVINAAVLNPRQPAEQVSLETWDTTLNLNLAAAVFDNPETRDWAAGQTTTGRNVSLKILLAQPYFLPLLPRHM